MDSLFRRKGFILLAMIVGGLIAYHVAKAIPPWYTATGLLVVDTLQSNIPELEAVQSNRTVEPWGGRSEARVLTSPQMI
ncbi:MAG: Wzz/FepE/Etk N-terminal domain-containing protein, partial [Pseudomonadota bacterium]